MPPAAFLACFCIVENRHYLKKVMAILSIIKQTPQVKTDDKTKEITKLPTIVSHCQMIYQH